MQASYEKGSEAQKIHLRSMGTDLAVSAPVKPRTQNLRTESEWWIIRWIIRIVETQDNIERGPFEPFSFWRLYERNFLNRVQLRVVRWFKIQPRILEPIDTTNGNCGVKYHMVEGLPIPSLPYVCRTTDFPRGYAIAAGGVYHAVFKGEVGAIRNSELPDADVFGFSRVLSARIDASLQTFELEELTVVGGHEALPVLDGKGAEAPISHHLTREKFDEMVSKKYNRTVLPEYEYVLGGVKYKLPEIPPYDVWVQHCTCSTKKTPVLHVEDYSGDKRLDFSFTETCPMNLIHAVVNRQAGALVRVDEEIGKKFKEFSEWYTEGLADMMEADGFCATEDAESKRDYLEHVRTKDAKKAAMYLKHWDDDLPRKQKSDMFVKTGESHPVLSDSAGRSTINSIKPRLINNPPYVIKARIGLLNFRLLGWFKKNLPEFFVGKKPA